MNRSLNIKTSHRLDGVGEYFFSKKLREVEQLRSSGADVINLGIGSPDMPPHASVIETLHSWALRKDTHAYQSYSGAAILRDAFSDFYKREYGVDLNPNGEILPLFGSKEGLMHIMMTYLDKGDKVLISNPGYPTYRSAVTLSGGECVEYKLTEENNWQIDFNELHKTDLDNIKIMIVNYPHMPTGAKAEAGLFQKLVDFALEHNILLVHDNPYSFVRNSKPESLLSAKNAKECAIELNSLSKSHNMAGWRVGMIGASAERITEILRFKSNMDSGMFLPMQAAAAQALTLSSEWFNELNSHYYHREALGMEFMEAIGCQTRKDQSGLFLWGKLPQSETDCYTFSDKILYEKHIFITPGGIFGSEGEKFIRISLCSSDEKLKEAIERIKK